MQLACRLPTMDANGFHSGWRNAATGPTVRPGGDGAARDVRKA